LQKAVSRDCSKTFSVPCSLVHDSWFMVHRACAFIHKNSSLCLEK